MRPYGTDTDQRRYHSTRKELENTPQEHETYAHSTPCPAVSRESPVSASSRLCSKAFVRQNVAFHDHAAPYRASHPASQLASGRPDIAPPDVGEDDVRVWVLGLYVLRGALSALAGAVVSLVEPGHLLDVVVPDAHGEDHCRNGTVESA